MATVEPTFYPSRFPSNPLRLPLVILLVIKEVSERRYVALHDAKAAAAHHPGVRGAAAAGHD